MFHQEFSFPMLLVLPVLSAYLLVAAVAAIMLARESLQEAARQRPQNKAEQGRRE
jgi:hypothetical protein